MHTPSTCQKLYQQSWQKNTSLANAAANVVATNMAKGSRGKGVGKSWWVGARQERRSIFFLNVFFFPKNRSYFLTGTLLPTNSLPRNLPPTFAHTFAFDCLLPCLFPLSLLLHLPAKYFCHGCWNCFCQRSEVWRHRCHVEPI